MAVLMMSSGAVSFIDDADAEFVMRHRWTANGPRGYVFRQVRAEGKARSIYLHRELMDAPKGLEVDHINGKPPDNRRTNLRLLTHAQNLRCCRVAYGNTGVRGVYFDAKRGYYEAHVTVNGKRHRAGRFPTLEKASVALEGLRRELMPDLFTESEVA